MMKTQLICITCPRSCHLEAESGDDGIRVTGNMCPRGIKYAEQELTDPRRMLTAVVRCDSPRRPLLPVRSVEPCPKDVIPALINQLYRITVKTPVACGDIVYEDGQIRIMATESRS